MVNAMNHTVCQLDVGCGDTRFLVDQSNGLSVRQIIKRDSDVAIVHVGGFERTHIKGGRKISLIVFVVYHGVASDILCH